MIKKIFFFIVFYLLTFSPVISATFNWTLVPETRNASSQVFYDKKAVFSSGKYLYFWQLTNHIEDVDDDIYSTITHNMVNCDTDELRVIVYSDFKSPMGRGKSELEMIIPETVQNMFIWRYFDRNNTIQGTVLDKICK